MFAKNFRGRGRGFTLLEVLVSMVIISIILTVIGSAIVMAAHAIPDSNDPTYRAAETTAVINQIAGDLRYALSVPQRSATAITFTVPDRTADGVPEAIQYGWSGIPGAPLQRWFNGTTAATMLDNVYQFALSYDLHERSETTLGNVESAESLLASTPAASWYSDYSVSSGNWVGQYLAPPTTADLVSWRVTRVRVMARQNGMSTGATTVELRTADGQLPGGSILDQASMLESNLGYSYGWYELSFNNTPDLGPTEPVCVVFRWADGMVCADILIGNLASPWSKGCAVYTYNGGGSWFADTTETVVLEVYCTVTTDQEVTITRQYLQGVQIAVQPQADVASRMETAVNVVSAPEVTP